MSINRIGSMHLTLILRYPILTVAIQSGGEIRGVIHSKIFPKRFHRIYPNFTSVEAAMVRTLSALGD